MADKGKSNIVVVLNLISNLRQFDEIVKNELSLMDTNVNNLKSSWDDPQYIEFLKCFEELKTALSSDLKELSSATDDLKIKVDKY